ncbi:MAG: hypothetical protein ABSB94_12050 [Syntrophorhabdales bacterium]|jgi:hypothetical protein
MEVKLENIQEAIDLAVKEKSNVLIYCSLTEEEIRMTIKDSRGCHIFRGPKGMIRIVPVEWIGTLGGTGPTISPGAPDINH